MPPKQHRLATFIDKEKTDAETNRDELARQFILQEWVDQQADAHHGGVLFASHQQLEKFRLAGKHLVMEISDEMLEAFWSLTTHANEADVDRWIAKNLPTYDQLTGRAKTAHTENQVLQLHKERVTAKSTMDIMEVNAQQIIEQALAAGQPLSEVPTHPAPDTAAELEAIAAEATHLAGVLGELRERQIPLTAPEAEVAIAGLHAIGKRGITTAWQLGLHAVDKRLMSQAKLAELLEASTATVSRRHREGVDET